MARYYSASSGSFWSPDPGGTTAYEPNPGWLGSVDRTNPASWNRYMYGLGDPINKLDPTGAIACDPDDDDGCDPADYDDDDDGGGGCAVDTCVTVSATADPVAFMGDDDDDDDDDDETQATFSTTVTSAQTTNCVTTSIAAGSLVGAGAGWIIGGGVGATGGGIAGSVLPGFGTIWGIFAGGVMGSEGGALVGASIGGAAGGVVGNIICNWIGPSGKPKIHVVHHPTKKRAKDGARNGGSGAPIQHPSPRKGPPHFHPTDPKGGKIPGIHHAYPW